jgi:isoleucyl-tRNA synthetase
MDSISDMNLAELFIVSECLIAPDADADEAAAKNTGASLGGLEISVREAPGTKCPRCWMHSVDADPETGLCPRCREVLKSL